MSTGGSKKGFNLWVECVNISVSVDVGVRGVPDFSLARKNDGKRRKILLKACHYSASGFGSKIAFFRCTSAAIIKRFWVSIHIQAYLRLNKKTLPLFTIFEEIHLKRRDMT